MLASVTLLFLCLAPARAESPPDPGHDPEWWAEPGLVAPYSPAVPLPLAPIPIDRTFQVLAEPADEAGQRAALRQAGTLLGSWTLEVAGVAVDGPFLVELADRTPDEPLLRVVREGFGRPVDLPDFLLMLDDILVAGQAGRRGEAFFLPAGRLRSAGALVHPDDVFKTEAPRQWGRRATLAVDRPQPQASLEPARDGDVLGPRWTTRFPNPAGEGALLRILHDHNPDFAHRVWLLVGQLRAQGAQVYVTSTVRPPERGYLMWGAFVLSRADTRAQVERTVQRLVDRNREWGLDIDVVWSHPDGWEATRDAARAMADSYDVVYATERGARYSNHYGGVGVDIVAVDLPRSLSLVSYDGQSGRFDLSAPEQPRDLSLTPELVEWVEANLGMQKLRGDYPHWNDRAR